MVVVNKDRLEKHTESQTPIRLILFLETKVILLKVPNPIEKGIF